MRTTEEKRAILRRKFQEWNLLLRKAKEWAQTPEGQAALKQQPESHPKMNKIDAPGFEEQITYVASNDHETNPLVENPSINSNMKAKRTICETIQSNLSVVLKVVIIITCISFSIVYWIKRDNGRYQYCKDQAIIDTRNGVIYFTYGENESFRRARIDVLSKSKENVYKDY